MVAIPTGLAINTPTSGDRTTASGFRKILAALLRQSAPGVPVPGILPAPGSPLLPTGDAAAMVYHVSAGFAALTRTSQGAYLVGTIINVDVPAATADATNPRYDVLYIHQPDPELADTGVARIDVATGVPASTPLTPSVPTGALVLGRKLVANGVTNTNAGTAIDQLASLSGLNVSWDALTGKPSSFPPSAHSGALVTSGVIPAGVTFNGDVTGTIDGHAITISQTAPTSPATGDFWVSW